MKVVDRGLTKLVEQLRALKGKTVRVGVLADEPKRAKGDASSKRTLVEVARAHEFGAPAAGIPQRSFLRATFDERRADIEKLQAALVQNVIDGKMTVDQALGAAGAKLVGWVQVRIADGIGPALKPETVRRKGSSKPLINTGQLRSAITFKVEGG